MLPVSVAVTGMVVGGAAAVAAYDGQAGAGVFKFNPSDSASSSLLSSQPKSLKENKTRNAFKLR